MSEIKVGEYVRTIDGYIRKIDNINIDKRNITIYGKYILDIPYKNSKSVAKKKIIKHSPNIIDLIEVGDFINGEPVIEKKENELFIGIPYIGEDNFYITIKNDKEIKSIVTKEQFKEMEYKL